MEQPIMQIRYVVREVLGDKPSPIFMSRIEKTLEEGATDAKSLCKACARVEKLVNLFIGVEMAKEIGRRFREIMGNAV